MAVAEEYVDDLVEDEDCGCAVIPIEVDGRQVMTHHFLPDDESPHAPTTECGCGPELHEVSDVLWVFEHIDQEKGYCPTGCCSSCPDHAEYASAHSTGGGVIR